MGSTKNSLLSCQMNPILRVMLTFGSSISSSSNNVGYLMTKLPPFSFILPYTFLLYLFPCSPYYFVYFSILILPSGHSFGISIFDALKESYCCPCIRHVQILNFIRSFHSIFTFRSCVVSWFQILMSICYSYVKIPYPFQSLVIRNK
jgi:hypothetical protein